VDALQAERSEMVDAFQELAGRVSQVVDRVIERSGNGGAATE
jgi:hypothetical protein